MVKHYLVTGGAGFIGSHIVEALLKRGERVSVFDDFSRGLESNIPDGTEVVRGSVGDLKMLERALKGVDGVFHCAALTSIEFSLQNPSATNEVNVKGTLNVILASRHAGVSRIVFSSSAAVYGDQAELPFREDMKPNPGSPYALEKYVGEEYCKIASHAWGVQAVCLRYFNVYGPRAAFVGAYVNVIPIFLRLRAKGGPLTITGDGTNTRDFVYVEDVVAANLNAMDSKRVGKGEVINIGSGVQKSVNEIAKYFNYPIEYIPPRLEQAHACADISCAKSLLGWEPKVSFEDGLEKTVKWFDGMKMK